MPLDPTISLQAPVPQPVASPLAGLGSMLDVQGKLNQNKLFQQTFMAKQKAGEIMATTPPAADGSIDFATIQQRMMGDPDVAPFAAPLLNDIRQLHLTNTQIAGQEQDQNLKGFGALQKALAMGYSDPAQLGTAVQAVLAAQPKDVQERLLPAVKSLVTGLTANLPKDPAQAQTVLQSRILGNQVAQGVSPDTLSTLTGKAATRDTGGAIVSGRELPAAQGGGFVPANTMGKTLAPQVVKSVGPSGAESTSVVGGQGLGAAAPAPGAPTPSAMPGGLLGQPSAGPAAAALGITPISQGPSTSQQEMMKTGASEFTTKYLPQLGQQAATARQMMRVLDWAEDAQKHFTPGGGAEFKANLASAMQGLGFSQQQVDQVANGSLAGEQDFKKAINQVAFELGQTLIPQGSRLSVEALKGAQRSFVGEGYDPRAIAKVFSQMRQAAGQTFDELQSATDYYKQGGDPNLWQNEWNKIAQKKGYVNTNTALTTANSQDYASVGDAVAAFHAGKITRDAFAKLAVEKGWATH